MPKRVKFKNIGVIEFPDDYTDEQITDTILKNQGQFQQALIAKRAELFRAQTYADPEYKQSGFEKIAAYSAGLGQGVSQAAPSIVKAAGRTVKNLPGKQFVQEGELVEKGGQWLEEQIQDKMFVDPRNEGLGMDVARGFGQLGSMAIPGLAAGKGAALSMGAVLEFDDAYNSEIQRQKEAGEPIDDGLAFKKSGIYALVATAIENKLGVGRILDRNGLPVTKEAKGLIDGVWKTLKEGAGQAVAGGIEESSQRGAQDFIVRGQVDLPSAGYEGTVGSIVQGIASTMLHGAKLRSASKQKATDGTQESTPEETSDATPDTEAGENVTFDEPGDESVHWQGLRGTVPETAETIDAQLELLKDPVSAKQAVLVPESMDDARIMGGLGNKGSFVIKDLKGGRGKLIVNTEKISMKAVDSQLALDEFQGGILLGLSQDSKPEDASVVVQTTTKDGVPVQDEATTPEGVADAIEAGKAVAPEGETTVKTAEDVIEQRMEGNGIPITPEAQLQDLESKGAPQLAAALREQNAALVTAVQTQDVTSPVDQAVAGREKKVAPAVFAFDWELDEGQPPLKMYNLTEDIPGHPAGSTVTAQTLENAGYALPENPIEPTNQKEAQDEVQGKKEEVAQEPTETKEPAATKPLPKKEAKKEVGRKLLPAEREFADEYGMTIQEAVDNGFIRKDFRITRDGRDVPDGYYPQSADVQKFSNAVGAMRREVELRAEKEARKTPLEKESESKIDAIWKRMTDVDRRKARNDPRIFDLDGGAQDPVILNDFADKYGLPRIKPDTPTQAAKEINAEIKSVANAEGQRPAKEVKSELVQRLEEAIKKAPDEDLWVTPNKITIEIPGDGTFTVVNTKENLENLLKKAKKISTVGFSSNPALPRGAIQTARTLEADTGKEVARTFKVESEITPEEGPFPVDEKKPEKKIEGMGGAVPSEFEPGNRSPTALKNATIDKERKHRGLPPLAAPLRETNQEVWDEAMLKIDREPKWIDVLIAELKQKTRVVTPVEHMGLLHRYMDLRNEYDKAIREGAQAYDDGRTEAVASAQFLVNDYSDKMAVLEEIMSGQGGTGTMAGRALAIRRTMMNPDFSLPSLESQLRSDRGYDKINADERAELKKISAAYSKLQKDNEALLKKLEEAQAALALKESVRQIKDEVKRSKPKKVDPKTLQDEITPLVDRIRKRYKEGKLDSIQTPILAIERALVKQGITELNDLVDAIHSILKRIDPTITRRETMDAMSGYGKFTPISKEAISVHLRDIHGQLQQLAKMDDMLKGQPPKKTGGERRKPSRAESKLIKLVNQMKREFQVPITDPNTQLQSDLDTLKKRMENKILELEQKLKEGDFTIKKPQKPIELDPRAKELKTKLNEIEIEWRKRRYEEQKKHWSFQKKAWNAFVQTSGLIRAIMTSGEMSAVLRQGKFQILGHPISTIKRIAVGFDAAKSEARRQAIDMDISNDPDFKDAVRAKLALLEHGQSISKMEEAYATTWYESIPVLKHFVGASERAYTTYLNRIRMDAFKSLKATLVKSGTPTEAELQAIAKFVNISTGRGVSQGGFERTLVGLNTILFAPRYVVSRFQLLTGQPMWSGSMRTRKLIAAEYARSMAGMSVYYGLIFAAMKAFNAGDEDEDYVSVELDWRSSDFGKIKVGNTRIDPWAGLQQFTVLIGRMKTGETKRSNGEIKKLYGREKPYGGDSVWSVVGRFLRQKLAPVPSLVGDTLARENFLGEPLTMQGLIQSHMPITYQDVFQLMRDQGVPKSAALMTLAFFGEGVQTYSPNSWFQGSLTGNKLDKVLAKHSANKIYLPEPARDVQIISKGEKRHVTNEEYDLYREEVSRLYKERLEKDLDKLDGYTSDKAQRYMDKTIAPLKKQAVMRLQSGKLGK